MRLDFLKQYEDMTTQSGQPFRVDVSDGMAIVWVLGWTDDSSHASIGIALVATSPSGGFDVGWMRGQGRKLDTFVHFADEDSVLTAINSRIASM
jgi:hypothetical protein